MNPSCNTLCLLLVFVAYAEVAHGYEYSGMSPCPDGHKAGETWYPPTCEECFCESSGYTCKGCGVSSVDLTGSDCHTTETPKGANYPECCGPTIVCRGEPGFDPTKLM